MSLVFVLAGTVGITGCTQVKEMLGMEEEKPPEPETPVAEPEPEPEPPKIAEKPIAEVELPALPEKADRVDDLFHFVPGGEDGLYVIVRDPMAFMAYAEQSLKFSDKPLEKLAAAAASNPNMGGEVAEAKAGLAKVKTGYDAVSQKIKDSGIDMTHGFIMVSTTGKPKDMVAIVSADKPDAFKNLMLALEADDADKLVCAELSDSSGHMACADSQKVLDGFKPDGDAAKHREAAEAALPGVNLDESNVIAHVKDNKAGYYVAVSTPPGTAMVHVSLPMEERDVKEGISMLKPGGGNLLRHAQPGSGFMWANLEMEQLKKQGNLKNAPPQATQIVDNMNGEFYFGGGMEPASLQMHVGMRDSGPAAGLIEFAAMAAKGQVPPSIPDLPGSKLTFETRDIAVQDDTAKAIHIGLTGVPEVDAFSKMAGFTADGWMYAAGDALSVVLGVGDEDIQKIAATEPGMSADTKITMPKPLVESLGKGEVSMIFHLPVDALQSPSLRSLVKAGLEGVPDVTPELVNSILDMAAPISSGTMWLTQSGDHAVGHMAIRGIGHTATEEGRDALEAAQKVLSGENGETIYTALTHKYPQTSRTAAYKTRSGIGGAAPLAASGIGLAVGAGVLTYSFLAGVRHEELAEELPIPEPEAEAAPEPEPEPEAAPKKKVVKKTPAKKAEPKPAEPEKKTVTPPDRGSIADAVKKRKEELKKKREEAGN